MIIIVMYSAITGSVHPESMPFKKLRGNSEQTWFDAVPAFNQLILDGAL